MNEESLRKTDWPWPPEVDFASPAQVSEWMGRAAKRIGELTAQRDALLKECEYAAYKLRFSRPRSSEWYALAALNTAIERAEKGGREG